MFAVAPVSVLMLGLLGMLVIAVSVARMTLEERRYRGPATLVGREAPSAPQPLTGARV